MPRVAPNKSVKVIGIPTESSSVAGMPPPSAPGIDQKHLLREKIKIARDSIAEEKKTRKDLQQRTEAVKERMAELERRAPTLQSGAVSFSKFVEEKSIERQRDQGFLGEKGKVVRSSGAAHKQRDEGVQVSEDDMVSSKQHLPPVSSNNVSSSAARSFNDARRALSGRGATHDFPNLSTFFSYPPRDASGFLLPQHHRSSKRTAYCTNYAGEQILGESESVVNRARMQRAAEIVARREEEDRERKRRFAEEKEEEEKKNLEIRREYRAPEITEPPPEVPNPFKVHGKLKPGESRTQGLKVYAMRPAGGASGHQISNFQTKGEGAAGQSSTRTLFYTDITGKRVMIDAADMPHKSGFVLVGL